MLSYTGLFPEILAAFSYTLTTNHLPTNENCHHG